MKKYTDEEIKTILTEKGIVLISYAGSTTNKNSVFLDIGYGEFINSFISVIHGNARHPLNVNYTFLPKTLADAELYLIKHNIINLKIKYFAGKVTMKGSIFFDEKYGDFEASLNAVRKGKRHPNYGILERKPMDEETADSCKEKQLQAHLKRDYKGIAEKRKSTMLDKYGSEHALQNKDSLDKMKQTNFDRYGSTSYAKTDLFKVEFAKVNPMLDTENKAAAIRKMIVSKKKNGNIKQYDGLTSVELAKKYGKAYSTFAAQLSKYGYENAIKIKHKNSLIEILISDYLDSLNIMPIKDKTILNSNYRPDFFIEDKKIIIECDGIFWHSDIMQKDNNYHFTKKEEYNKLGFKSLFFREDEIIFKTEIVKSMICNSLMMNEQKIYARKCKIAEEVCSDFLESNHLMGKGVGRDVCLKYNDEVVSCMKYRVFADVLKIERFCTKKFTSVVGAHSKLLKYIINKEKPSRIETFVDNRYGTGNFLLDNGFQLKTVHVSFKWVDTKKTVTYNRMRFKGNTGYDEGMYKIWDCGQSKFVMNL